MISDEDKKIIEQGPISDGRYYGGAALGTYIGFGVGHAIQGRYQDKGWIFTAGQVGSLFVAATGITKCLFDSDTYKEDNSCSNTQLQIGVWGLIIFKGWEIFDLWYTPYKINQRYKELSEVKNDSVTVNIIHNSDRIGLGLTFLF